MALKLTLQPDSPILMHTSVQRLEFYVNIGGSHFLKQAGTYHIAVRYYPDQASASAAPDTNAITITGLPRLVPAMRPLEVLNCANATAYEAMYAIVTQHLLALCGEGTVVEPLL